MKIIDAHLHFATDAYFDEIAKAAGHENSEEHLLEQYRMRGMVHGIVMGNLPVEETKPVYPPFLSYCVGLDSQVFDMDTLPQKLYDDKLAPVYELAARYHKPVAVHTGLTATDHALLKYSHPLVMDEAATKFREVQFVMCHFGEPWFTDAAAVIEKNPNVAADLSGMLERKISDFEAFLRKKHFYIERLKGWLEYLDSYDRFMFGTDWPLANLGDYIDFTKEIIPQEHWDDVFYKNAMRIYHLPSEAVNPLA